ncbi:MAG: DoxX family protein [Bacteroidetes bacterium]|nr:MAG: DoxX family protein [Bacteroidota bacterium]
MKSTKIIYWATTGLFSLMIFGSAMGYLFAPQMAEAFAKLGFPQYFRIELAIFKILGVVGLLLPAAKGRVKEWTYAGFGIVIISALVAHIATGDGPAIWVSTLISGAILVTSYLNYHKLQAASPVKTLVTA